MYRVVHLSFALLLASAGAFAEEVTTEPAPNESPPVFAPELPKPPAKKPEEAYIPFAHLHSTIQSWELNGDKGIWIKSSRKWYYATFFAPCPGLGFGLSVGFMPDSSGRLDRFASVYTPESGRCHFSSLVESGPPPPKLARRQPQPVERKSK